MNYQFPVIKHIADVLPAIKDKPEFIVVTKPEGYTVINYAYSSGDSFDINNPMLMECRGLIFDTTTGKLLRRAFHKFFNLGEKEWTKTPDLTLPHHIELKLDGSMITPIKLNGKFRLTTKMGVTDVSEEAEKFITNKPKYQNFFEYCDLNGITPIFEWLDSNRPIVIKHSKDDLILLAMRWNESGNYVDSMDIIDISHNFSIPLCPKVPFHPDIIKQTEDIEGIVISFKDGHRIKVKTDWYVSIHRFKDDTSNLRKLVKLILEDKFDDFLPTLPEENKVEYEDKRDKVWLHLHQVVTAIDSIKSIVFNTHTTKKDYALSSKDVTTYLHRVNRGIWFRLYDGNDTLGVVIETVLKHCNKDSDFDEFNKEWLCLSL